MAKEENNNTPVLIFGALILVIFASIYFIPVLLDKTGITVSQEKYYFNGFLFEEFGPLWYTQIQRSGDLFDIPMHYGPRELLDLDYDNETSTLVKNFFFDVLPQFRDANENYLLSYLTFNPYENVSVVALSAAELTFKLRQTSRIRLVASCTDNSTGSGCEEKMAITCDNIDFPVIFLNQRNVSSPYVNVTSNCLEIVGDGPDLMKMTNRVLYSFFGIMS